MFCGLRTIGVCSIVASICVMLASLSWQWVLSGIAIASLAWAVFSLSNQLRPRNREPRTMPPLSFRPDRPRRERPQAQLYNFRHGVGNHGIAP